jgi:SH3-like domain-containing protein
MTHKTLLLLACFLTVLPVTVTHAQDKDANKEMAVEAGPHLPLPRFATLRSDEANMRTGPGTRYPIEWVYRHKGLPVEIVAEYDIWRRVRDPDGVEGWFHKTELTGKRSATVTGAAGTVRELRDSRDDQSAILAHLQPGAEGQLISCQADWCKLKFDGIKGYLHKSDFWGAYTNETFD